MNQFRIFHYYSRLQSFYGVRTNYDWRKLNLICAYLQLLRDELPCFIEVDDGLCENDIVEILNKLYDCQKIISEKPFNWDKELDLVDNWDDYARNSDGQSVVLTAGSTLVKNRLIRRKRESTP